MLRVSTAAFRLGSRCFSTMTGTVKFWDRKKAYGFLIPDGDEPEVFCHRSFLVSAPVDDTRKRFPFLMEHERVSFEIVMDNDKRVARNVKMENGSPVPMFRNPQVLTLAKNIKKDMGLQVYDILDDENMSQEDKVSRIMQEFQQAKEKIDDLKAKQMAEQQQQPATPQEEAM